MTSSMKTIKPSRKKAKYIKYAFAFSFSFTLLFLTLFGVSSPTKPYGQKNLANSTLLSSSNNAFATTNLIEDNLKKFSANGIWAYKPNECELGSGGTCGKTFKEKYWSSLSQKFDSAHVAAILGNIVHEGGGPTKWEYKAVRNGQFVNGWTWEKLYNECESSCAIGVGAYQITSGLSNYLHYINEKAPDLIKYFEDPSYSISGDNLISKIGESEFERLMQIESDYVFDVMLKNHHAFKMDEFLATTTPGEAARYWAHNYEICAACGYNGGDSQLIARASTATLIYAEMKNFTCVNSGSTQIFKGNTFNLSDGELYGMIHMALVEQSSTIEGLKMELTQMANRTDKRGRTDITTAIRGDTFYYHGTREAYSTKRGGITDEQINAARDVLINGNRIAPLQVLEHDCIGDISWVEINGEKHYASHPGNCRGKGLFVSSYYVPGKTIIHNKYGSTYVFYSFPISGDLKSGDPFGYFPDDPPTSSPSSTNVSVSTNTASSSETTTDSSSSTSTPGKFVWYGQFVDPWKNEPFGTSTIGKSGCAPTAFAMLASMQLNKEITPTEAAKIAGDGNMYVPGEGADPATTKYLADYYHLQYEKPTVSSESEAVTKITDYLKNGWMVIVSGKGNRPFTTNGHYIGIRGITESGRWLIADPGHMEDYSTKQDYDPTQIVSAGLNIGNINAIRSSGSASTTSNACSNSSANIGAIEGGLSEKAAQKLALYYNGPEVSATKWGLPYGKMNCVSFSKFFINRFTNNKNSWSTGNGKDTAHNIAKAAGLSEGNEPQPFSVFSVTKGATMCSDGHLCGHTGIVVAVNGNDIITVEAAYKSSLAKVKHRTRSFFVNTKYSVTFTYLNSILNQSELYSVTGE